MSDELKDVPTRKLAMLFVESAGFASLFTTGMKFRANTKIISGIPKDAVVEGCFANPERHGVMIMLRSESFAPVMNGVMPPILPVEIGVGK